MKINLDTFRILSNYVLVKPDADFTTYQIRGRESGLIAPDFKYEGEGDKQKKLSVKERNVSVTGTVYAIPKQLNFHLEELIHFRRNYHSIAMHEGKVIWADFSILKQIGHYENASVNFKVEMEVNVGDKVNFTYQAHKECLESGRVLDTELGEMYLIKYDRLYMTVNQDSSPKKMLNGWMIVEPDEIKVKQEGAQEFIELTSGLVGLAPKSKLNKSRKNALGTVIKTGSICKGYLQEPEKSDPTFPINEGEQLIYDPRACQKLEYESHQTFSDKTLHLIQRKDIWLVAQDGFDLSKIGLAKKKKVA